MTWHTGDPVQLVRPLDFLAITDHPHLLGLPPPSRLPTRLDNLMKAHIQHQTRRLGCRNATAC